jgi:hypothetical protein
MNLTNVLCGQNAELLLIVEVDDAYTYHMVLKG